MKSRNMGSAMTSKVKGRGDEVTWSFWQVLAHKTRIKCPRNSKIGRLVAHATDNNVYQFQCENVKGQG